jgi:hypothetical protein
MEHLGLELGDLVAFYDLDDYIPSSVPSTSVFMLQETRASLIKGYIQATFLEVRQP